MSYIILAVISLIVISSYNSLKRNNKGFAKMIDSITPSWNIEINFN